MLWLGRILAILNLIAVLAFSYLAMETYTKRKAWSRAIYATKVKHEGLPTTEDETDPQGNRNVDKLDSQMLRGLPQDVKTVEQAGESVVQRLKSYIGKPESRLRQIEVLLPLLETAEQRAPYIRLRAVEDNSLKLEDIDPREQDQLEKLRANLTDVLDKKLTAFKKGREIINTSRQDPNAPPDPEAEKAPPQYNKQDSDAMRRDVALLYASLLEPLIAQEKGPDKQNSQSEKQIRSQFIQEMVQVVGMEQAGKALRRKARVMHETADFLRTTVRKDELIDFLARHRYWVQQAVDAEIRYQNQAHQSQKKLEQVNIQKPRSLRQQAKYSEELKLHQDAQDDNAALLKELTGLQEDLFKLRVALRDKNQEEQELNEQVKELEKVMDEKLGPLNKRYESVRERRKFLQGQVQKLRLRNEQR